MEAFWYHLLNQLKTSLCFKKRKERKTKSEEGEREDIKEEIFGVLKLGF